MSTEGQPSASNPWVFDVTKIRCPMCGATVDEHTSQCAACGEELHASSKKLTVPLFSLTAIGVCTFFWSLITGMILVWLNCRRLERYDDANKTVGMGIVMFVCLIVAVIVIPDFPGVNFLIGLASTFAVTKYADSILQRPFFDQLKQGGPYRSVWLAHGIGLLVVMGLLGFVIGLILLLGMAGVEIEV